LRKEDAALHEMTLKERGAPGKLQDKAAANRSEKRCRYLIEIISMNLLRQNKLCPLRRE